MNPDPELARIKRKIEKRLRRQAKLNIKILVPQWLLLLLHQRRPAIRVMLNL
jgi:hypothetical protein